MFSQVSICPQGDGCLPQCMLGYTPRADLPWADTLQAHTPPGHTPPGTHTPQQTPPPAQCMLGYGQQAGGMHPTGMQSCLKEVYLYSHQ